MPKPAFRMICAVFFLLLALPLAGCAFDQEDAAPRAAQETAGQQFLLSPGDTLKLTVYGDDQVSGPYMIDEGGYITIPLVGPVQANGKTKSVIEKEITALLIKTKMYQAPLVSVDVATLRPFYILGEVNRPGSYPYQPSLDVFQAVAMAGGYTPRASRRGISIIRGSDQSRKKIDAAENTPIFPGDSLMVRQRLF